MAHQRGREDDKHELHVQSLPPPSFLSLPDIAHNSIASFLRNDYEDSCFPAAEVSCALLELYGGCLTKMLICQAEGRSADRLAGLLQRQKKLEQMMITCEQDHAILGLCQAVVQGCCRELEALVLYESEKESILTQKGLDLLSGAFEADGALPKLRILVLSFVLQPGGLSKLPKALAGGTAPLLQKFLFNATECNEDDLASIADMLEARALIPSCKILESLEGIGNDHWFDDATLETKIRLLRALLPIAKELPAFTWENAFEACFLQAPALYLTCIEVAFEDDRGFFSWRMLEAAPALVTIVMGCRDQISNGTAALQSITTALRTGALQSLQGVVLINFDLNVADVKDFTIALGVLVVRSD